MLHHIKSQLLLTAMALSFASLAGWQGASYWQQKAVLRQRSLALQQAAQAPQILQKQQAELKALQSQLDRQQAASKRGPALLEQIAIACQERNLQLLSLPQERQLVESGHRFSELRFSLQGRLEDILYLSHRWEYHDRIGRLVYFKLAREDIRQGHRKKRRLVASLRFKRLS